MAFPKNLNKKQILRIVFIIASISSLLFVPWVIVRAWISPLPNTVQEQVNEAIEYGFDGMIVYVDKASEEPTYYVSGFKNRENQIATSPQDLFKIASISKLYIAVAVAKLVNTQQLNLDKTLAHYLPELAGRIENDDEITLRMLVQHRSGIPNFTDTPNYWEQPTMNSKETFDLVLDKPADFEPDEKYSYSNSNYFLLGEIMNRTLGYNHHDYINTEILKPLELNNTYNLLSEVNINDVVSGYHVGYDADLKSRDFINPSGSMIATAEDVGIFLRALNDGSLLNDNEQKIYSSIYEFEHTGLLPGYSSIAKYHKDIDAVVIQFVNTSGGYTWNLSEIVYNRIVKILRREQN